MPTDVPASAQPAVFAQAEMMTWLGEIRDLIERRVVADYVEECLPEPALWPSSDWVRIARFGAVRFRRREDLRHSMATLYGVLHALRVPLLYVLRGHRNGVDLYIGFYGVSREGQERLREAFRVMQPTIRGVLPGCSYSVLREDTEELLKHTQSLPEHWVIKGVPTCPTVGHAGKPADSTVTGIERLVDAMAGDEFTLVIAAQPVEATVLDEFDRHVADLHDFVHLLSKVSVQTSAGMQQTEQTSDSFSEGRSTSKTEGTSRNTTAQTQPDFLARLGGNIRAFALGGRKPISSTAEGDTHQEQTGESTQWQQGRSSGTSLSLGEAATVERTSKLAASVEELLSDMHKRIQEARGTGMWQAATMILAHDKMTCQKAAQVFTGMLAGERSLVDPVRSYRLERNCTATPFSAVTDRYTNDKRPHHPLGVAYEGLYTFLTTGELAFSAGLPCHEVPALIVEEMTDYARAQPRCGAECSGVCLGKVVDRGQETGSRVLVSTEQLNRHCFVTGATGSGKSNTVRHLLLQVWKDQRVPFLVIEPVKSEYRSLQGEIPELQVFTLGHASGSGLSLNPFAFEREVGLVPHIDHLKAAFNASLGMYSSMPFILEDIIYRVYGKCGWDLTTGTNALLDRSAEVLDAGVDAPLGDLFLPKLSDLLPLVQESISGFFPSMTDYGGSLVGALRARLSSLTRGAKGDLLDTRHCVPMQQLLERPCVLELWAFSDNEEKAFVMALILAKLYEFRERQHLQGHRAARLEHLLVIEEAHRLLAKPPGQSELASNSRAKGVEVFADILAEVRSYGQGVMIVDQIPAKLVPDVIKNTDVKIAHRLVAKDDRELLGATMNLDERQVRDLARARPGTAAVFFEGLHAPIQVQVDHHRPPENAAECRSSHLAARRRQMCFGWRGRDALAVFDDVQSRMEASRLVHGILCIGLSQGTKELLEFRDALRERVEFQPTGSEWAFLVEGLHGIREGMIRPTPDDDVLPLDFGTAGYFVALAADLLSRWVHSEEIGPSLARLRGESVGYALRSAARSRTPTDFLTHLVALYVQGTAGGFHRDVEQALRANAGVEELDWSALQKALESHCGALLLSTPFTENTFVEIGLRLLMQFRTEDHDVAYLAGLAVGTLREAASLYGTEEPTRGSP